MAAILIIEDEPLIAMMLEDFVESLDHKVVGTPDSVEDALAAVEGDDFDVAILDINLRENTASWPVADALADKGKPFILASGGQIDSPPERHAMAAYLAKPYTLDAVREAIEQALTGT